MERPSHHHPCRYTRRRYRNSPTTTTVTTITVYCDSHAIFTTVTSAPAVVREWLYGVRRYHSHRLRRDCLLVGLGVQWKPSVYNQNPPATLQLCVGHRCLIFQLSLASTIPLSLRRFLQDRSITFVGVNNKRVRDLLSHYSEHGLYVRRLLDLVDVASEARGHGKGMSMERLADLELNMGGVMKDPEIGRSFWDEIWLSDYQVKYACVDAFVSFLLGKSLKAWKWKEEEEWWKNPSEVDEVSGGKIRSGKAQGEAREAVPHVEERGSKVGVRPKNSKNSKNLISVPAKMGLLKWQFACQIFWIAQRKKVGAWIFCHPFQRNTKGQS